MERKVNFKYQSDLIVKYLTNNLSPEEQIDFDLWLNESPANSALVESFRNTDKTQKEVNYLNKVNVDEAWKNVAGLVANQPVKPVSLRSIIGYAAAAVVVLFAFGAFWYSRKSADKLLTKELISYTIPAGKKIAEFQLPNGKIINLNDSNMNSDSSPISAKDGTLFFAKTGAVEGKSTLRTPKAGEYKMVLPDGTKVWLNALSSLSFDNDFNKEGRKVYLKGEAYFEVAHNKQMPFVVSFNNSQVTVLGTHFNINTYNGESKTTLLEGAVKIAENGREKFLKPGEEATINGQGIEIAKIDTYKSVAWKDGLFLFEEENIDEILMEVARWYDVQIKYEGKPSTKKYSGNIRRQANLDQVLEMLTTVSGNKFTLTERTITVKF